MLNTQRPVLLVELEYRHGAAVEEVFAWLSARHYTARAVIDGQDLVPIDVKTLRDFQDDARLAARLRGNRRSGYINNLFFLPDS